MTLPQDKIASVSVLLLSSSGSVVRLRAVSCLAFFFFFLFSGVFHCSFLPSTKLPHTEKKRHLAG